MAGAEQPRRRPIAKGKAALEEWFLELRDGKRSQREYRCEFQQLAAWATG
jgi:hypothetical protein